MPSSSLLLLSFDQNESSGKLFTLLEARLKQWGEIEPLKLLTLKKPSDQSLLISAFKDACAQLPALVKAAPKLLEILYDNEVIEDEAFLTWRTGDNGCGLSLFRSAIEPFIKWIETETEEES